jgi:hypothetical protein
MQQGVYETPIYNGYMLKGTLEEYEKKVGEEEGGAGGATGCQSRVGLPCVGIAVVHVNRQQAGDAFQMKGLTGPQISINKAANKPLSLPTAWSPAAYSQLTTQLLNKFEGIDEKSRKQILKRSKQQQVGRQSCVSVLRIKALPCTLTSPCHVMGH